MRLIDADALKEMICNNVYPITDTFNSQDYGMFWTGGIEKAIDEAPTIDAKPIRHGHWDVAWKNGFHFRDECSVCGTKIDTVYLVKKYPYCPNCGAKMDEVEEDE